MARILLIETDRLLADNLSQFLGALGHEVTWHADPQLAVYSADEQKPDVIVLDLLLTNRSGIEFLYEFRSYPDWQNLPVVIFTGVPADDLSDCLEAFEQLNVRAYRYKPTTSMASLAQTLDQVLQLA